MTIRAPLSASVASTWRKPHNSGFVSGSLLVTVLAVAAGSAPFSQQDWPNPQTKRTTQSTDSRQSLNLTTLATPQSVYVIAQSDWQNPVISRSVVPFAPQNLLQSTLAVAQGDPPFVQVSWANPIRLADRQTQQVVSTLLTTQAMPFMSYSNERHVARQTRIDSIAQNLLSTTLATSEQSPFYQVYWPNPQWVASRQTQQDQTAQQTVTQSLTPFNQSQWPIVFRAPVIAPHTYQYQYLHATTLYVAPGDPPFYQTDWKNPIRSAPRPNIEDRNTLIATLTAQEATTLAARIFAIQKENRTYAIAHEIRTYSVT